MDVSINDDEQVRSKMSVIQSKAAAKGSATCGNTARPSKIVRYPPHDRLVRRVVETRLKLEQLRGKADIALLRDTRRRLLLVQKFDGDACPVRRLMAYTVRVGSGDSHGSIVEGAAQDFRKKLEHFLRNAIERNGLVGVHPPEQGAEGGVVADVGEFPVRAIPTRELGPLRLTHSGVKTKHASLDRAGAVVCIVDAPINTTCLSTHCRRFTKPDSGSSDTIPFNHRFVVAEEPLNAPV